MKKSDIVNAVLELMQDRSGPMQQLVSRWVDIVLMDISSRPPGLLSLQREQTTSMVAGQREYELPITQEAVTRVFVPEWGDPQAVLIKKDVDGFLKQMLEDGTSLQGRPKYYNIFSDNTLRLHPIPDSDNAPASPTTNQKLHIYTRTEITDLDLGDDITEIKKAHIPTIIMGAYAFGATFDSLVDSRNAESRYERGVARLLLQESNDPERAHQTAYNAL